MQNVKIKFFSTVLTRYEEVEQTVNDFCKGVDVIDVRCYDTKVMVIYKEVK